MATPTLETFNSNSAVLAPSTTLSIALTLTSATLLTVGLGVGSGDINPIGGILSVTWNTSETMTKVTGSEFDDNSFEGVAWWSLFNPTAGAHNVVITTGSATVQTFGSASAWIGTGTLSLGTPSGTNNTTANPSVTVADTANGDIVVSVLANDEGGTVTQAGTTLGEVEGLSSDSTMSAQYQTASGANTVCSWTEGSSGASWAVSGMAIKDSGGGGGATIRRLMMLGAG